jgi:hypothetical protein
MAIFASPSHEIVDLISAAPLDSGVLTIIKK